MQKTNSRFTITVVIILAIGLAIAVAGVVGYQMQSLQLDKQLETNRKIEKDIADVDAKIATIDEKKLELTKLQVEQGMLDQNLTDVKYLPTYLEQIQIMARATQNDLLVISPGEIKPLDLTKGPFANKAPANAAPAATPAPATDQAPKPAAKPATNGTQVMKITLTTRGSYTNLISFLDRLKNFQKLVYVKSISVSPSGIDKNGVMQVSTQLDTYAIIIPQQNLKETSEKVKEGGAK